MTNPTLHRYDWLMDRLLWVTPTPQTDATATRPLGIALAISATRCIVQYGVLPFALPLLGASGAIALPFVIVLNALALLAVISSLRRIWRTRWVARWRYLPIAGLALFMIGAFVLSDLGLL